MSWRATAWVNQVRGITRSEKLLMFVLSDRYNEDEGCARPSIPTIAEEALMSPRTASRTIISLQKKGLLEVVERPGRVSLYKFLTHSTHDTLSVPKELRDDKKCLPTGNTHANLADDPCQHGGIRTVMNRKGEEPLGGGGGTDQIDLTQNIVPWVEKIFRNHPKCYKLPWIKIKYPRDFEELEVRAGIENFRQGWIDHIESSDAPNVFEFLREMRAMYPAGEKRQNQRKGAPVKGISELEGMKKIIDDHRRMLHRN